MKNEICRQLGMSQSSLYEVDVCQLTPPKNLPENMIYTLFLAVGLVGPSEIKNRHGQLKTGNGYSAYRPCVDSTKGGSGRFGFSYDPEWKPDNALTVTVPEWAIAYAMKMQRFGNDAYATGYYRGEDAGYKKGRNMLVQLAKCEITVDEMENYDPLKDRDRPLYQIWDGKKVDRYSL